jgi:hypothetical protein
VDSDPNIGLALENARAEAVAAWLDERPPREKPDPDEIAGLDRRQRTAPHGDPLVRRDRTTAS